LPVSGQTTSDPIMDKAQSTKHVQAPLKVEIVHVEPSGELSTGMALLHYGIQFAEIIALGLVGQYLINKLDPRADEKQKASMSARMLAQRLQQLGRDHVDPTSFSMHELQIFQDVVAPSEVQVSFEDIGGHKEHKAQIMHSLCTPETTRAILRASYGKLAEPAKGILLYGPPGCGKTLLAKAIATQCAASFINLKISHVTDKWHGESQKLTDAVFSLARKLAPTIIFIDEVETFLRDRGMHGASFDSATTGQMKASFLSNWDGLTSNNTTRTYQDQKTGEMIEKQLPFEIIVVGATNRAGDIDEAFLRRMPLQLQLKLPDLSARTHILTIMFDKMKIKPMCDPNDIAACTDHYSGSDLKELCRRAVMERVKEVIQTNANPRPLSMKDFKAVLASMNPAGLASLDFKYKQQVEDALKNNGSLQGRH
jgi:SpoVK/Ycf46/Vps4 family AAA+-type ATPase